MKRKLGMVLALMLILTAIAGVSAASAETGTTYRVANLVKQIGSAWYQRQQLGLDAINAE